MCSDYILRSCIPVVLAVLLPLITCPGCSVKENRDSCPCLLELDLSDTSPSAGLYEAGACISIAGVSGNADGFMLSDTLSCGFSDNDAADFRWSGIVPRGSVLAGVISGVTDAPALCVPPEAWMRIRPGSDCPEVWLCCSEMDTRCDHAVVPMALHKSFCMLTIMVKNVSGAPFPFRMEVRGNVCGYGLDGKPIEGRFIAPVRYTMDEYGLLGDASEERYLSRVGAAGAIEGYVRLPRQVDASLLLDIISEDDVSRTFAIGNYIDASGYDWNSTDLKDIAMEIDYARMAVDIRIGSWMVTEQFEAVI